MKIDIDLATAEERPTVTQGDQENAITIIRMQLRPDMLTDRQVWTFRSKSIASIRKLLAKGCLMAS